MEGQLLPPSSKHSPLVGTLADKFAQLTPGEMITYDKIENAIRVFRDQQLFRYVIAHAVRRALRDRGIVIENVRNVGYVRATIEQVARDGVKKGIRKIRKVTNRVADKIATVNPMDSALSEDTRRDALTAILVVGAVAQFTSRGAVDGFKRQALEQAKVPALKELLPK